MKATSVKGIALVSVIASLSFAQGVMAQPVDQIVVKPGDPAHLSVLKSEILQSVNGVENVRIFGTGDRLVVKVSKPSLLSTVESSISRLDESSLIERDLWITNDFQPSDSRYSEQWAISESIGGINSIPVYEYNQGDGVIIAVVDTGYIDHPDLDDSRVKGYDFIGSASSARDGNGRDSDARDEGDFCNGRGSSWHGAHVAGISSAVTNNNEGIVGGAPLSRHQHIRTLGACGGSFLDIADGVIWASGSPVPGVPEVNQNPAGIINMSLSGRGACFAYAQAAIDLAVSNGSTVIVAAGNDNDEVSNYTPANCNNVITVASTNRAGGRAFYSNYGDRVDIAAPGGGRGGLIISTIDRGRTTSLGPTYAGYQGTSMATPYVSAVAALMKSIKPTLTPDEMKDLLVRNARDFPAGCNGCGSGIVDAKAAVEELLSVELKLPVYADADVNLSQGREGESEGRDYEDRDGSELFIDLDSTNQNKINLIGRDIDVDLMIDVGKQ